MAVYRVPAALAVVLASVVCVFQAPAGAVLPRGSSPAVDPTTLVDPFIGTGKGAGPGDAINMFPGADMPFGMLQWSPDTTPNRADGGGYTFGQDKTLGLSLTHLSGPGCPGTGDVPLLPAVGALGTNPGGTTEPLAHSSETAQPGYYSAAVGSVHTELAVTQRTGMARLTYPSTTTADLIVKAADSAFPDEGASLNIVSSTEIEGSVTSGAFCLMPDHYTAYFAIQFNRPFTSSDVYQSVSGSTTTEPVTPGVGAPISLGPLSGGYVQFNTTSDPTVLMKVGLSFVSEANALDNIQREDPGFDFDQVRSEAHSAWENELGKIAIGGGTHDQQVEFYTALYHSLLHPNVFSDANGQYMGFDEQVHQLAPGDVQYANFSGWDTYRCTMQLQALLDPSEASAMVRSLLRDAAEGGGLPKWEFMNQESSVMNGDAADALIADAWAFGARDFDAATALADMVKGATEPVVTQGNSLERPDLVPYQNLGYVPTVLPNPSSLGVWNLTSDWWGSSETLEYSIDDFSIGQLASALGQSATASTFAARAQNWQNLFDGGNSLMAARGTDGAFSPGGPFLTEVPTSGQAGFEEGNAHQYTWEVSQNVGGLVAAMGGGSAATSALDTFFSQLNAGSQAPYYWSGNEPGLGTPYVYDWTGAPWRTQQVLRAVETTQYSDTSGGEPGNDDLGAMSASFVWNSLGLYPATAGTGSLVIGSPLFSSAAITLGNGNTLSIDAPAAATNAPYVSSLTVNGVTQQATWLSAATVAAGPTLSFGLSTSPDPTWGAAPADAPPSYSAGEAPAIGFTSPTGQVSVPAGSSRSFDLGVQGVDPVPQVVTWSATVAGVQLSSNAGQLTLAAGSAARSSRSTVTLTVKGLAPGLYPIRFSFTSLGHALPTLTLDVMVGAP